MLIGHTSQVSFIVASASLHKLEQFVSISDNDGYVTKMILLDYFFCLTDKLNYGVMKMVVVLNIYELILNIVQFK
jgi:hypothetical protein